LGRGAVGVGDDRTSFFSIIPNPFDAISVIGFVGPCSAAAAAAASASILHL
jgi:hypothetical protein